MNEKLKDRDILLVREKGSNELSVAKMDKDGTVKPFFSVFRFVHAGSEIHHLRVAFLIDFLFRFVGEDVEIVQAVAVDFHRQFCRFVQREINDIPFHFRLMPFADGRVFTSFTVPLFTFTRISARPSKSNCTIEAGCELSPSTITRYSYRSCQSCCAVRTCTVKSSLWRA